MSRVVTVEVYQVDNESCADHLIGQWFDSVKNNRVIGFSTCTQLSKLRLEHKKGNIRIHKVITHTGEELTIDNNGSLSHWPKGFQDEFDDILAEILGW